MRKFLIIILSSLALISCDKKTKDFAGNFIKAINENDRVAIVSMYPDAKNFDIASPIVEYGFKYYHKTVGGVNVPAHGKATIFIDRADAEYGPDYKKATIKFNKGCDVSKLEYSFTGKEYENYLATKK